MDSNIVEIWLRRDPVRWLAGALAGAFAGIVALAFAMILSKVAGLDVWFPIKVAALPILGNSATEFGMHLQALAVGFIAHEALCMFLGAIYAHFTGTNALAPLLGMGLTWGAFSWIFINNLFWKSFLDVRAAHLSIGAAFFICLVFGVSLTSVAFFDQALRKTKR